MSLPWKITWAATFALLHLTPLWAAQSDDCEYNPNMPCEAVLIFIPACADTCVATPLLVHGRVGP